MYAPGDFREEIDPGPVMEGERYLCFGESGGGDGDAE
jgi:hypothetical protein